MRNADTIGKKKFLAILLDNFLFGNIFLALCSVAMGFTTFVMNGYPWSITPVIACVFFSTIIFYNFHHFSFELSFESSTATRHSFKRLQLSGFMKVILLISTTGFIISFLYLNTLIKAILILLSLPVFAYSLPLIRHRNERMKLRDFLFVKLALIAFVWTTVTLILPLLEKGAEITSISVACQFSARFFFMFAICIPFEIRDTENERRFNVRTIPVIYGIRKTKVFGIILVVLCVISNHLWGIFTNQQFLVACSLDLSAFAALIGILYASGYRSEYYCKLYVDGIMVLRLLFVYLAFSLL